MLRLPTVLLTCCSVLYYCLCSATSSVAVNTGQDFISTYCEPVTFDTPKIQELAEGQTIISCPTATGLVTNSVTWFLTRPNEPTTEIDVDADDGLMVDPGNVRVLRVSVMPSYEGAYSCRRNNEDGDPLPAGCLLVVGTAVFSMCLPDHTCAQPFPLTATKTGNVSFNSSIEFVNGGILNSNITQLELKKLGSTGSEDQTLYQWCDGANCGSAGGRIDVEMSSPHNLAPTLLTLRDLNASDAGQYRITVRTVSVPGEGFTRMSIDFNLTVDELEATTAPEATQTTSPLSTTLQTSTATENTQTTPASTSRTSPATMGPTNDSTASRDSSQDSTNTVILIAVICTCAVLIIVVIAVLAIALLAHRRRSVGKSRPGLSPSPSSSSGPSPGPTNPSPTSSSESSTSSVPTSSEELSESNEESLTIHVRNQNNVYFQSSHQVSGNKVRLEFSSSVTVAEPVVTGAGQREERSAEEQSLRAEHGSPDEEPSPGVFRTRPQSSETHPFYPDPHSQPFMPHSSPQVYPPAPQHPHQAPYHPYPSHHQQHPPHPQHPPHHPRAPQHPPHPPQAPHHPHYSSQVTFSPAPAMYTQSSFAAHDRQSVTCEPRTPLQMGSPYDTYDDTRSSLADGRDVELDGELEGESTNM